MAAEHNPEAQGTYYLGSVYSHVVLLNYLYLF